MGNNRGCEYSNVHKDDDTQSLKEHWDFTWADMGKYDLPAFLEKVIEVTGKPKVTISGYSTGGSAIVYALAKDQDYYAERVNRFVALSTCQYWKNDASYEDRVLYYQTMDNLGIYNWYGGDESSMNLDNCKLVDEAECLGLAFPVGTIATGTFMYYD